MSESIDLTNLPKRKQRVTLTERELREGDLEKRIAELEQQLAETIASHQRQNATCEHWERENDRLEKQLAEAQAKAELWNKVRPYFRYVSTWRDWFEFNDVIPRENRDTIEDAVRRLP